MLRCRPGPGVFQAPSRWLLMCAQARLRRPRGFGLYGSLLTNRIASHAQAVRDQGGSDAVRLSGTSAPEVEDSHGFALLVIHVGAAHADSGIDVRLAIAAVAITNAAGLTLCPAALLARMRRAQSRGSDLMCGVMR